MSCSFYISEPFQGYPQWLLGAVGGTPGETKARDSEKRAQGPWVNGRHVAEPPPLPVVCTSSSRGKSCPRDCAEWILGVRFPGAVGCWPGSQRLCQWMRELLPLPMERFLSVYSHVEYTSRTSLLKGPNKTLRSVNNRSSALQCCKSRYFGWNGFQRGNLYRPSPAAWTTTHQMPRVHWGHLNSPCYPCQPGITPRYFCVAISGIIYSCAIS